MRHLKQFESNISNSDIYLFHDKPVMIINIEHLTSSEISVSYLHEDGTVGHFNGDIEDFEEVFKENDNLEFKKRTRRKTKPRKPKLDPNKFYNLVYYAGNKKIETIRWSLPLSLARGLKKQFLEDPKYRLGRIEIEPN